MKILVVRYRFIGDMILTVPFLRNLRNAFPDSEIDMLVSSNSGEVIEDCPYVNNFIYFDINKKERKTFWYYVKLLRKNKYDKAYILKRSWSSALLCFFAGIKYRIGFDTERRGILLNKKVPYDKFKHESLCCLDLLISEGIKINDTYLENWVREENIAKIQNIFEENNINFEQKKVIVNITATNEGKVWPKENFIKIIEYLSNEKNIQVIFSGSSADKILYENLNYSESLKIKPINLCGKTSLKESLALIKLCDFVLGNDSGNLHMASSVKTPVIGIYGPMPFEKWKALGNSNILLKSDLPCMPCFLKGKCTNNKACLTSISVNQVKKAIDLLAGQL